MSMYGSFTESGGSDIVDLLRKHDDTEERTGWVNVGPWSIFISHQGDQLTVEVHPCGNEGPVALGTVVVTKQAALEAGAMHVEFIETGAHSDKEHAFFADTVMPFYGLDDSFAYTDEQITEHLKAYRAHDAGTTG